MGVLKERLTLEEFIAYSTSKRKIKLSKKQEEAVKKSAEKVESIVKKGEPVYGINTGFGALCNKTIEEKDIQKLQANLVRSHSCGIGDPLSKEETKGSMLLLINSLSKGYSGIRLGTLETLIDMYNKEVLPVIPEKGSLGASGDLIPLAHLALVLIGEGNASYKGKIMPGKKAMKKAGIKPVTLDAKEGLALINGTHVTTSLSALSLYYALQLPKTADIAAAVSFDMLKGIPKSLDPKIHDLKPYKGQKYTAENIKKIIEGGRIIELSGPTTDEFGNPRVQDPYSLRCIPQVHGPVKDELQHMKKIVETEMNSVTDNPLIFEDECLSGGNFHAQYMAIAMDNLASLVTTLAAISERRIDRLLNEMTDGPFLTREPGLNSGFMIAQYLATALISINKILVYPAVNTSIPVSGNQEDYVSMAMTSALKAREVIKNVEYVIAIELLCGAEAQEYSHTPGRGTQKVYETIRKYVAPLEEDRVLADDIEKMYQLVHEGTILKEVEKEVGDLK